MRYFIGLLLTIVLGVSPAFAATYYVDGAATDDTGVGSEGDPKKYINSGCLLLSSGDTLIIADGTYTTANDYIENVASGTSGSPTIVRAETDFGVTLSPPYVAYHPPIHFRNKSYITVQGFIVNQDDTTDWGLSVGGESDRSCDHIEFIRCGAKHGMLASYSTDILFEECFAWGGHNYHMQSYRAYRITWRRCLVRADHILDGEGNPQYANDVPQASFVAYNTEDAVYENNIAIDSYLYSDIASTDYQITANPYTPLDSTRAQMLGNMSINAGQSPEGALNVSVSGFYLDVSQAATYANYQNNVAVSAKNYGFAINNGDNFTFAHNTSIGNGAGFIATASSTGGTATDSLMLNNSGYGVYSGDNNYFAFHGNASGTTNNGSETNSITTDPSQLYPLRIEAGSTAKGTGIDGDRGANILYMYDEGTLTANELWPFPNEAIIKATISNDETTSRGWTASSKSLTEYVWEYLGNTMPEDIYGSPNITCYPDLDNDLYPGTGSESVTTCSTNWYESSHFTSMSNDCDDTDEDINPGLGNCGSVIGGNSSFQNVGTGNSQIRFR